MEIFRIAPVSVQVTLTGIILPFDFTQRFYFIKEDILNHCLALCHFSQHSHRSYSVHSPKTFFLLVLQTPIFKLSSSKLCLQKQWTSCQDDHIFRPWLNLLTSQDRDFMRSEKFTIPPTDFKSNAVSLRWTTFSFWSMWLGGRKMPAHKFHSMIIPNIYLRLEVPRNFYTAPPKNSILPGIYCSQRREKAQMKPSSLAGCAH